MYHDFPTLIPLCFTLSTLEFRNYDILDPLRVVAGTKSDEVVAVQPRLIGCLLADSGKIDRHARLGFGIEIIEAGRKELSPEFEGFLLSPHSAYQFYTLCQPSHPLLPIWPPVVPKCSLIYRLTCSNAQQDSPW